jgi:3-phenylpropionate/trans-cinnamate dioxygenase ferredoxin subunit
MSTTNGNGIPEGYARAARLTDLEPGAMLGVELFGDRVCVARLGDDVFALEDRCTHALYPLSRGTLLPDGTIECGWHGAKFDCRSGAACRGPASFDVPTFDVLLHDGDVYVRPKS